MFKNFFSRNLPLNYLPQLLGNSAKVLSYPKAHSPLCFVLETCCSFLKSVRESFGFAFCLFKSSDASVLLPCLWTNFHKACKYVLFWCLAILLILKGTSFPRNTP